MQADDAREAAGLARKRQKMEDGDADPLWRTWSLVKFNELETKEHARRAIEVPKEGTADAKEGVTVEVPANSTDGLDLVLHPDDLRRKTVAQLRCTSEKSFAEFPKKLDKLDYFDSR